MGEELTVVCVYWEGVFRGRESVYSPDWVSKLYNMVKANLDYPFEFVCLTNVPEKIEPICKTITLRQYYWRGWWAKLELFRPGLFTGKVLYLDIDVFVVNDIRPLTRTNDFTISGKLAHRSKRPVRDAAGKRTVELYNSSVMVWEADCKEALQLWGIFTANPKYWIDTLRGDQDFIAEHLPRLQTFSPRWVMKYRDLPNKSCIKEYNRIILGMAGGKMPKKNTSIAAAQEWARKIWRNIV